MRDPQARVKPVLGQLSRFASVGVIATLTHVGAALIAQGVFDVPAQLANLIGFCCAVALSYVGHAYFTFGVTDAHGMRLPRFVVLSLLGLAVSSMITFVVHSQMGFAFPVAMALVAITVPVMTFVGAKFWAFAALDEQGAQRWTGVIVALAIAVAFYAVFQGRPINHDTAWYLVAVRKWLDGAQLYVDIVEVNPPLNFYLTLPAIWLADLFGLTDTNGQYALLAALLAAVLIWVWRLLLTSEDGPGPDRALWVLVGGGVTLIVPALDSAGQRDHLLVFFLMPWLVGFLTRSEPDRGLDGMTRAGFAAIGICLKHYFLIFPIALTLVLVWRRRSLWPIVSPANLTMLAFGLGYVAFIALRHPAYLTEIVPMALLVYDAYGSGKALVLQNLALPVLALFSVMMVMARREEIRAPGIDVLTMAVLAAVTAYLLQFTGFPYQAVPILTMVSLGAVWMLIQLRLPRKVWLAAGATLAVACLPAVQNGFYKNSPTDGAAAFVAGAADEPRLAVLSTSVWASFPLVLEADAQWTSRYPALWLVPGAVNGLSSTDCSADPERCAALEVILDRTRADIVTDFEAGLPHVLIVDRTPHYFIQPNFSFLDFLSDDPRFAGLMGGYTEIDRNQRFTIYRHDVQ